MNQINLKLQRPSQEYSIFIRENALSNAELIRSIIKEQQLCLVSSANISKLYGEKLLACLPDRQIIAIDLPEGEQHKNLTSISAILDKLMQNRFNRDSAILALGGGVIGDMAGFAAASFQRGIALYQIPTTLLAQVDSSIGGKTGVNHHLGKNMIGAFHQPQAVIIDPTTLQTLPESEFIAGLGEVIKYGLIDDPEFFDYLEQNSAKILSKNPDCLEKIITTSCAAKARVVQNDEFENSQRALLNLGHTFGHALETLGNYTRYKHGEAVAIGMRIAAELAVLENKISQEELARIRNLLQNYRLPCSYQHAFYPEDIYRAMFSDKKIRAGKLRLVKFASFCNCEVSSDSSPENILRAIEIAAAD